MRADALIPQRPTLQVVRLPSTVAERLTLQVASLRLDPQTADQEQVDQCLCRRAPRRGAPVEMCRSLVARRRPVLVVL